MNFIQTRSFKLAVNSKGDVALPKLALVLPGKLDTKDYLHLQRHVEYLAGRGYVALSFDPPGTWESPGGIALYTVTNYLKAINELIEYFGNKPTLLVGHSRGGSMAMLAGITNPHITHFVAVMSHYGPGILKEASVKTGKEISYRDLPPGTAASKTQKKFELPRSYFEDAAQYNALEGLRSCSKPKLFFFSEKDVMVNSQGVRDMYAAAASPKMLHELDSEHDYRYRPDIIEEVQTTIGEFLDRYPT